MRIEFSYIAAVAIFWGAWPLFARSSGCGGPLGSLVLSVFGLIPIAVLAFVERAALPSLVALLKLGVAGTMMGLGLVAFNIVANGKMEASVSIPIIDAAMLVVSSVCAIYFFQESITPQKMLGLAFLLTGIAVLRPS